jgi:hypothetical protein
VIRSCAAVALCALVATVGIAAAKGSDPVVPAGGKLSGHSYAGWGVIWWQELFAAGAKPPACGAPHGKVRVLFGNPNPGTHKITCTVKAGLPIYVPGLSVECSTVEKAPYHGSTPAQLKACAKRQFKDSTGNTASVDGRAVAGYAGSAVATPVFRFRLPKKNLLGSKKLSGKAASYGLGVALTGFDAGTHTVRIAGAFLKQRYKVTIVYTLKVR